MSLFHYDFIVRGIVAGVVIAFIAPLIGIFLVLRRYSLIADTLSHVSLAGIALALLVGIHPLIGAIGATVASSTLIERLRFSKRMYGESALALFLSGSLALAVVLLGLAHGFTVSLFHYLFGSIVTVTTQDIVMILGLGLLVCILVIGMYKELVYISFDEESARVSGIATRRINQIFVTLSAIVVSLSIPIVGILLISALLVIPIVTALQFRKAFIPSIIIAQCISVFSILVGVITSFYFDLAPGGTIVLVMLTLFGGVVVFTKTS